MYDVADRFSLCTMHCSTRVLHTLKNSRDGGKDAGRARKRGWWRRIGELVEMVVGMVVCVSVGERVAGWIGGIRMGRAGWVVIKVMVVVAVVVVVMINLFQTKF